jgi:hypothetical protein
MLVVCTGIVAGAGYSRPVPAPSNEPGAANPIQWARPALNVRSPGLALVRASQLLAKAQLAGLDVAVFELFQRQFSSCGIRRHRT